MESEENNIEFENIQIEIETLPNVEKLNYFGLQKAHFKIMLINLIIVYSLILTGLIIFWIFDVDGIIKPFFQWILLGILILFLMGLFLVRKSFEHRAYAFRDKDISYKSGWLWRKSTTVPFNRVQHCEVSQSIFDRYWNLGRLKVFTAGGSSSDVTIPGLDIDQARDLKAFVLNKVQEDEQ